MIRIYNDHDRKQLFQLIASEGAAWKSYYEEQERYQLALHHSTVFVLLINDQICGYIRCKEDDGYGVYVYDLLVHRDVRGQALGKRLMDHVYAYFNHQPLYIMSDEDGYYQRLGYARIGSIYQHQQ